MSQWSANDLILTLDPDPERAVPPRAPAAQRAGRRASFLFASRPTRSSAAASVIRLSKQHREGTAACLWTPGWLSDMHATEANMKHHMQKVGRRIVRLTSRLNELLIGTVLLFGSTSQV